MRLSAWEAKWGAFLIDSGKGLQFVSSKTETVSAASCNKTSKKCKSSRIAKRWSKAPTIVKVYVSVMVVMLQIPIKISYSLVRQTVGKNFC